jgi:hypothetical protein
LTSTLPIETLTLPQATSTPFAETSIIITTIQAPTITTTLQVTPPAVTETYISTLPVRTETPDRVTATATLPRETTSLPAITVTQTLRASPSASFYIRGVAGNSAINRQCGYSSNGFGPVFTPPDVASSPQLWRIDLTTGYLYNPNGLIAVANSGGYEGSLIRLVTTAEISQNYIPLKCGWSGFSGDTMGCGFYNVTDPNDGSVNTITKISFQPTDFGSGTILYLPVFAYTDRFGYQAGNDLQAVLTLAECGV